jgi:XTP/dITP diphosphohydrolase
MPKPPIEIVLATGNLNKFKELKLLLKTKGFVFHPMCNFLNLKNIPEKGKTFEANAAYKAMFVARKTNCLAIADDSGLEVDYLNGSPGVRSARFSGRHGNDKANNIKLLRALKGQPASKRNANYRCVLAIASPDELLYLTEGVLNGRIAEAEQGAGGFGYDPVFYLPRFKKNVAEISLSSKNKISHRGIAARKMRQFLSSLKS